MNARTEQKAATRRRLVSAAEHLFAQQGIAQTKTLDVARQAGLSHGGLFVHFATKDKLLAEVAGHIGREITDRIHALVHDNASLRQVLEAHVECISESERAYAAFLCESRHLPEDVLRTWVSIQSAISSHLTQAAQREMNAGTIKPMEHHLLFNTWIGLLHHYLLNQSLFAPGASVLQRHGAELINHFLSLLLTNQEH